jgi:hypothetical protein
VERMRKLLASPVIIMPSRLVLSTVVNFMKDYDEWKGTPTQLLELLGDWIGEDAKRSRWWPKSPHHLSRALIPYHRHYIMIRGIENVIYSSFAFISIPNRLKVFISSYEIRIPYISQIPDMSDISKVFEVDDIFTLWMDT